jgi:hypothetical protein
MTFRDYHEAAEYARARARKYKQDQGIRKTCTYGGRALFEVTFLPRPENCFGPDARAERVCWKEV